MAARLRPVLGLIVVASCVLVLAGPASAASPQTIYGDLADNGRLDGRYSDADIARAFNLQRVIRTDARQPAPTRRPAAATPGAGPATGSDRRIPFTGLDLALLTLGGGPMLLIGLGLRRRLAASAGQPRVVGTRS
jgi:hypothetical protein